MITKIPATLHKAQPDTLSVKYGGGQAYRRSGAWPDVRERADLLHRARTVTGRVDIERSLWLKSYNRHLLVQLENC
jgi:hypothetical protein